MLRARILSLACAGLMLAGGSASALDHTQQVGTPLNLAAVELELAYSNDFSGDDRIDRETDFVADGKRTGLPGPGAEWIAEGWGGADICAGKLWVAPAAFKTCGEKVKSPRQDPSHMVVWNKNRFPANMMFEFTVNHNGSDNGLTLVFFAAEGDQGQDIFNLDLPPRNGVYRNYNKGRLKNYTVSYWSRNQKPSLVLRGEAYSNRIRKNPGANVLATNASLTDKCNDCDFGVRILKIGGHITAEINGTVVNHVTDTDPHGGGYIGLRSMQGVNKVSYDNFKVWSVREAHTTKQDVARAHPVTSQDEFVTRMAQAQPGDEVVIKNGTYSNWSVAVEANGSKEKPIVIRPETRGGVVFSSDGVLKKPMFTLKGSHIDFDGFIFRDIALDAHLFTFLATRNARFINNDLGNIHGADNIGRMVLLVGGGADNVFANNTFHDCENVLVLSVRMGDDGISKRSHIHHNVFKSLNMKRGGEGTTTLQLASSGRMAYDRLLMQAVVEHNYFENIMGDAETISNRSNANIIRNNTFVNTKSLVIRQGHNVTVEDNVLVNTTGPAIRVYGSGHKVRRNTIKNSKGDGNAVNYGMGSGLEARQIYLLIGQSNMAGRAPVEEEDEVPIEGCELFNGNGEWEPATNPLNRYSTIGKNLSIQKLGPGYGFAKRWRELHPNTPLGLVVNARGGTKIAEWGKGTDYYNQAVARLKAAQADGSRLGGILWHQGEGDSRRTETYLDSLSTLFADLRSDLNAPDLPFVAGLLEMDDRDFGKSPRLINEVLLTLPSVVPNTAVASTEGLLTMDGTHFDSASQRELGKRYAEALFSLE